MSGCTLKSIFELMCVFNVPSDRLGKLGIELGLLGTGLVKKYGVGPQSKRSHASYVL